MTDTYWKLPFVWPMDSQRPAELLPHGARWLEAAQAPDFVGLVADCLAASVDGWDVTAVAAVGACRTAEIVVNELAGYGHEPQWWQVLAVDGAPAGFVLPVIFEGCSRDGLDEATILHIGVLPSARGRGLGRALLRRATRILVDHGVWRIYCDTAVGNAAMIRLFESEGWQREAAHERPTFARSTT